MPKRPHQNTADHELATAVRSGTRAVLVAQVASQVVSLVVLAAMYRLIAPDAYGLLGQVLPAAMLPRMAATLGLATAVVQHRELDEAQLTQLFWFNLAAGLAATAMTAALAPLLAYGYGRPELLRPCLAMAGVNLLASLGNHHGALLERSLRLGPLSLVRVAAQVVGGVVGIGAALSGQKVGALIAQQYAEWLTLAIGVWLAMPWRPGLPRLSLQRSAAMRELATFSSYYSLSTLVNYVGANLDKLVFPLLLGPQADRAIGLYSQAFNLMIKPVYVITAPLTGVMVAALARARGNPALFADITTKFFRLAAFALLPCSTGLLVVAPDAMRVLAGPQWTDAGLLLAALAPAVFAAGFANLAGFLLASVGRAGQLLFASLLFCAVLGQAFVAGYFVGDYVWPTSNGEGSANDGTPLGGLLGVAIAYSMVVSVVWLVPYLSFAFRSAGIPARRAFDVALPALRPAVVMGMVVWGLRQLLLSLHVEHAALRLAVLMIVGVAIYLLLARAELRWFLHEWVSLRTAPKSLARL